MAKEQLTQSSDPTMASINETIKQLGMNRRRFLSGVGLAGVAAVGAGVMAGCGNDGSVQAAGVSEADVLNFALNLEYFEATLYSYLATGADLTSANTGSSGTVTGGPAKLTLTSAPGITQQTIDLVNEIYFDELQHVIALRAALSSAAVVRPNLNLSAVTPTNYLTYIRLIEDVGVTAYAGAATLLTAQNLQYAAQILAVEAFHSGALRLVSIQAGAAYSGTTPDNYDVKPADPGATASLAGPTIAAGGFFATAGAAGATTTQTGTFPGMAYKRTTSQVLSIVYNGGTANGGFFPAGLNGTIKTV